MNRYAPYSTIDETFTFPAAPSGTIAVEIVYADTNETIYTGTPTLVSGNTYKVDPAEELLDSAGTYEIKWSATVGGQAFYDFSSFVIENVYITSDDFFDIHPEMLDGEFVTKFDSIERTARRIIDTYTGQDFQYVKNKTKLFEGNGREKLYVDDRIILLSEVLIDSVDWTTSVKIDLQSKHYLKIYADVLADVTYATRVFPKGLTVSVKGDWGWRDVPWEITQAAELLIIDLLDDTRREAYRYGINRMWQDTNRLEFDPSIFKSTGNIDVDTLLMDYIIWTMDYVY